MIEKVKKYLEKGVYIVIKDTFFVKLTPSIFIPYIKNIVAGLLKNNLKIIQIKEERHIEPYGNIVIRRVYDNQLIIINKEKWVYRVYTDKEQHAKVKKGHAFLEKNYKINNVQFISDSITKENFFWGKTLIKSTQKNQNRIFDDIVKTINTALNEQVLISYERRLSFEEFKEKAMNTLYPNEMKKNLFANIERSEKLYNSFIWNYNHGDLTPQNILFNNNDYSIMDGERCEILPLIYDVSNLMNNNVLMTGNSYSYQCFFEGKYDSFIKKTCGIINVSDLDRKLIIIQMLFVKSVIAWDSVSKGKDERLMKKRWDAVSKFI